MSPTAIVELILLLLMAGSAVALLTSRLRIPYTIALVFAGFAIDLFHVPITRVAGGASILTPEIIFVLFLPPLLFESAINIDIATLRANLWPILLFAIIGVAAATLITGYAVYYLLGLPLLTALLFGALIAATDPVSVIALFRELGVSKRLLVMVEGESLFNDGTAAVAFQLILASILTGALDPIAGVRQFFLVVCGGILIGLLISFAASKITELIDEPRVEITLTTLVAYGSYLAAEHFHVSGVMATVVAGLVVGNYGAHSGMSPRTRLAVWSFWEYAAFVVNSLIFLLIGIEVHVPQMLSSWYMILIAIAAVLLGRLLVVYALAPLANRMAEPIPAKWNPVLVWGGLHGSVSIALVLSLPNDFPHRATLLTLCFGVCAFSIVVQGLTMRPLLARLGLLKSHDAEYSQLKASQVALGAARLALERMEQSRTVSPATAQLLASELTSRASHLEKSLASLQQQRPELISEELRLARLRLLAAERSALQLGVRDGLISAEAAEELLTGSASDLDPLHNPH